jgi:hypothetical protein
VTHDGFQKEVPTSASRPRAPRTSRSRPAASARPSKSRLPTRT